MAETPQSLATLLRGMGADTRTVLAMLVGAFLESNANPAASGGGAYGVWQLQGNPQGADTTYAASVMLPRYQSAVKDVPDSLWLMDPTRAAEQAAYLAERPTSDYYSSQGSARVTSAYAFAQSGLGGNVATNMSLVTKNPLGPLGAAGADLVGGVGSIPGVGTVLAPLTVIGKFFGKLSDPHFWLRVGEFVAGIALAIFGAIWLMSESKSVGGVANTAIKGGSKIAEVAAA